MSSKMDKRRISLGIFLHAQTLQARQAQESCPLMLILLGAYQACVGNKHLKCKTHATLALVADSCLRRPEYTCKHCGESLLRLLCSWKVNFCEFLRYATCVFCPSFSIKDAPLDIQIMRIKIMCIKIFQTQKSCLKPLLQIRFQPFQAKIIHVCMSV